MSGIFVRDCACGTCPTHATIERHGTDAQAVTAAYRRWQRRFEAEAPRYWCVHGPSGHVIGIRGSPLGDLPPPI